MRVIAGIVIALCCAAAAIVYAGWSSRQMPPSPVDEAAKSEAVPAAKSEPADRPDAEKPEETVKAPAKETDRKPVLETVRGDIRNVTPDHVLPGPEVHDRMIVRLPAAEPPPPPPRPPEPERWRRALVVSPGVLKSGTREIVIAGIEPLAGDAVCGAGEAQRWPCGKFASSALRRLIRQRPIECDPVEPGTGASDDTLEARVSAALEDKSANSDRIVTHCRIAGRDIGEWLVEQGWAKPKAGADYDKAFGKAQKAGRGQWRQGTIASLPDRELPQADPIQTATGEGPLLAPGLSATDALIPLPEPDAPPAATIDNDLPASPNPTGGLDQ
ncbi:MAG: thermonuclease family protein [Salaquimonas sp.]|nr:thermonuclease family protein [Salaquimonas sp.]